MCHRDTGPRGLELIREYEGFSALPYIDSAGTVTIGYGSTRDKKGDPVTMDHPNITEQQGWSLLSRDVDHAERVVGELVSVPLNQFQFDALVSFVYNLGVGNFKRSTLLSNLNMGRYESAAKEFHRWKYAGGKVLSGLVRRRAAEYALFILEPVATVDV